MNELIVLCSFFGLQACFAWFHHVTGSTLWQKVFHLPVVVVLAHPTVAHTLQDYAIHFVIYSGKVIAAH